MRYEEVQKVDGELKVVDIQEWDEPFVSFARKKRVKINGSIVEMAIGLSSDPILYPPLYKWELEHNTLDRRDIRLLDVPGLNNTPESAAIKMRLYQRIVDMYGMKKRYKRIPQQKYIIRYDDIYKEIGLTDPDVQKRRLIKSKIDRCLKYWKGRFIADYQHERDKKSGNQFYAVRISLIV